MTNFLPASFAMDSPQSFEYELHDSFIFDSGSTGHICNDIKRFIHFKPSLSAEYCLAGSETLEIGGWGSVKLRTVCPGFPDGREITLTNVAYIESFHCSVVSFKVLKQKGVEWDTKDDWLLHQGMRLCKLPTHFGQWCLEYNQIKSVPMDVPMAVNATALSSFKARSSRHEKPDLVLDVETAHRVFGHINKEALHHLEENCKGLKITGDFKALNSNCEVCRLGDSHRQISRLPRTYTQSAFNTLCWDNIAQDRTFGDVVKISHFYDPYLGYHFVYRLLGDSTAEVLATFRYTVNYIELQYSIKVKELVIDNEQAILNSNQFWLWVNDRGFKITRSAPYAHEQHGKAEASGKMLTNRATKLLLDSKLPQNVMAECYEAAGYLLNRTPVRRNGWKSPQFKLDELLGKQDPRPRCHHILPYGCKAYGFIQNRAKTPKLVPKAHIGYLVGYISTNIWMIWVPDLRRCVAMRDVTFDTTKGYKPDDEDLDISEEDITHLEVPQNEIDLEIDYELMLGIRGLSSTSAPRAELSDSTIPKTTTKKVTPEDSSNPQLRTPENTPEPSNTSPANVQVDETSPATAADSPSTTPSIPLPGSSDEDADAEAASAQLQRESSTVARQTRTRVKDRWEYEVIPAGETRKAPKDVKGDVGDKGNIVEGKRVRKPTQHTNFAAEGHPRTEKRSQAAADFLHIADEAFFYRCFQSAMTSHAARNLNRLHRLQLPPAPKNWRELLNHPHMAGFMGASKMEYGDLDTRGTFKHLPIADVPESAVILPLMWVWTYKFDENDCLERYKARLCVRGDYWKNAEQETYAATLATRVFRTLMAIAAYFDLDIFQLDAVSAFTNADLDEVVFTRCPDGFTKDDFCLLLLKALYGLPRAPLLWFNHLCNTMRKLGLSPVPECACLFTNDKLIVFFFVDDICVLCHPNNRSAYTEFKEKLMGTYKMKDLGEMKWFLGIRVIRDRTQRKLWLCQDAYISKIVAKFHLENFSANTPMLTEGLQKHAGEASQFQCKAYQEMVGSCVYSSVMTRPDTAYAAHRLSQHNQNPGPQHDKAVKRCLAYLNSTKHLALQFGGDLNVSPQFTTGTSPESFESSSTRPDFVGYSDASFADDTETRKSTQGHKMEIFNGTNDWKVMRQTSVATSTTEAELTALSSLATWLLWFQRFFDNINLKLDHDLTAYCDNLQTVRLLIKDSPKLVTKLKHVDIHQHWLREKVERGEIKVEWISTSDQAADGFTKPLSHQKHLEFVQQLKMVNIRHLINFHEEK